MKLRRLAIRNVGVFDQLDLTLPTFSRPDRADVVLLTGPNGSGKTTLLRAIGSILGSVDSLDRRFREDGVIQAEVSTAEREVAALLQLRRAQSFEWSPVASWPAPKAWDHRSIGLGTIGVDCWTPPGDVVPPNEQRTGAIATSVGPVFAYGSNRLPPAPHSTIVGSRGPTALEGASSFEMSIAPGVFDTWIANLKTSAALARDEGDTKAVGRYLRHLGLIEVALGELLGESFEFVIRRDPIEVLARVNGSTVPLDLLPDGLRATMSWIGDVLRRLDLLNLPEGTDSLSVPAVILLDEVDAHLHPAWQRAVLHIAERLLPNAQIIASTHSPFVVQSAVDACVIKLGDRGRSVDVMASQYAESSDVVLTEVLGLEQADFGLEITKELEGLRALRDQVLRRQAPFETFEAAAARLAEKSRSLDVRLRPHVEDVRQRLGSP